jgi:hypothetical protein
MFFCSIVLIISIFTSRKRLSKKNLSRAQTKRLIKDIRFSITTILMDVLFVMLTLPLCVCRINKDFKTLNNSSLVWKISFDLYHTSFVYNFFVYFFVNSVFREEFLIMMKLKSLKNVSGRSSYVL